MQPIPCAHCGNNFMRHTLDPEAPKLCNNCIVKENLRNPKKEKPMQTVDVLIKCPPQVQAEIEEHCITVGIDFTKYFLNLHDKFFHEIGKSPVKDAYIDAEVKEVEQEIKNEGKKGKAKK